MSAVKERPVGAGCAEGSVARVVNSYDRYFDWCVRGGHSEIPTLSQFVGDSGVYRQWTVVDGTGLCVGGRTLLLDDAVVDSELSDVRSVVHVVGNDGVSGASVGSSVPACAVGAGEVPTEVLVGPNGGVSVGRGENYSRNLLAREKKKKRKFERKRAAAGVCDSRGSLQKSLEAKWEAENKLAVKQAERKLALLEARDLDSEKRMQRAQIMRTTEAAKVQTERAYASLKRTGNVPGFAETVVTSDSGLGPSPGRSDGTCISPDSSVSQQEIRAMMKENEDLKLTLKRIERDNPALVAHHMEGHGVKTAFTLDSDGMCPVDEPGCMGVDGKYHLDSYERNPKFYRDRFRAEEATERYFNRE